MDFLACDERFEGRVICIVVWHFQFWVLLSKLEWGQDDCASSRNVHFEAVSPVLPLLVIDWDPFVMTVIESLETAESFLVSFEQDVMAGSPVGTNEIVRVRVVQMEVKDKHELASLKDN
jgi:hypothetical protein